MILKKPKKNKHKLTKAEQKRLQKLFSDKVEKYLDAGHGACWLKNNKVAKMIQETLLYFDKERYSLLAWSIMPNHVHVVVRPESEYELSEILHSWRSFTAKEANKLLNRKGLFWQPEPYDHLIRDEEDLIRCIEYTFVEDFDTQ